MLRVNLLNSLRCMALLSDRGHVRRVVKYEESGVERPRSGTCPVHSGFAPGSSAITFPATPDAGQLSHVASLPSPLPPDTAAPDKHLLQAPAGAKFCYPD